jgi:uncharacterized membrane protein
MAKTDTPAGRLIEEYLQRLRRAAADLPTAAKAELVGDIETHLSETCGTDPDEATVRQVLDELGSPEEITAAAATDSDAGQARRSGGELAYDVGAVLVLLLGGFVVPIVGWIAGVVMLWSGPRWRPRHKWIGTLLWPAAIAVGVLALAADHVAAGHLAVVVVVGALVVLVGLIAGFAYLLRAAQSRH